MDHSAEEVARRVLDRYGRTYAEEADIRLADEPAPLFQLLVLAQLLSARIGAGVAVAAAVELRTVGWTTPKALRDAKRPAVIAALGRAGYRRYDERTATQLHDMAELVLARYGGDLRRLAGEADGDVVRASGWSRRSRASARPAPPSSCARFSASGPGCGRTWTTGRVRAPGGSACPATAHGSRRWSNPATWRGSPRVSCLPPCSRRTTTRSVADPAVVS